MPDIHNQIIKIATLLEKHYRDVQDFEFTVENGKYGCSRPEQERELRRPRSR